MVLEARGPKRVRSWQGWFLLEAPKGKPIPWLHQLPVAAGISWLVSMSLQSLLFWSHSLFLCAMFPSAVLLETYLWLHLVPAQIIQANLASRDP